MTGPYARAARWYLAAGWAGVLPLPAGSKTPPPAGHTGIDGRDPSGPDVWAWAEGPHGAGNVALRLPDGVIGLDVDDYDDRGGGATLARGERVWGALPATWRATSRGDATSGVRLYRVPFGARFLGTFGPGTEVVQRTHRYLVVAPSIHPNGAVYRWHGPDGSTRPPHPADLPALPAAWTAALAVTDQAARPRRARARGRARVERPTATPPARPTVDALAARTRPAPAAWIAAALADHLHQLRTAPAADVALDLAAACGYLAEQADRLGLDHTATLRARLADAIERAPGRLSDLVAAADHGQARAEATPWRLTNA